MKIFRIFISFHLRPSRRPLNTGNRVALDPYLMSLNIHRIDARKMSHRVPSRKNILHSIGTHTLLRKPLHFPPGQGQAHQQLNLPTSDTILLIFQVHDPLFTRRVLSVR